MLALFCFEDLITESHALSSIAFANEKLLQRITASPILTADDWAQVYRDRKLRLVTIEFFMNYPCLSFSSWSFFLRYSRISSSVSSRSRFLQPIQANRLNTQPKKQTNYANCFKNRYDFQRTICHLCNSNTWWHSFCK